MTIKSEDYYYDFIPNLKFVELYEKCSYYVIIGSDIPLPGGLTTDAWKYICNNLNFFYIWSQIFDTNYGWSFNV